MSDIQILPDYDALEGAEIEALNGLEREGYYAWARGDLEKLEEIEEAATAEAIRAAELQGLSVPAPAPELDANSYEVPAPPAPDALRSILTGFGLEG